MKKLNKQKPFEVVIKMPGVRYKQDGCYFNCGGQQVGGDSEPKVKVRDLMTVNSMGNITRSQEVTEVKEDQSEEAEEEDGDFPFSCAKCGAVFRKERGLNMHMMRVHGDVS